MWGYAVRARVRVGWGVVSASVFGLGGGVEGVGIGFKSATRFVARRAATSRRESYHGVRCGCRCRGGGRGRGRGSY